MPVQVSCPKCQKPLSVGDDAAGRGVRCPHCQTVFHAGGSTVAGPAPTTAGSAAAPPSDQPPAIGPYAVRKKLGEGAFGVVYRCHDAALDRDVAVKVLRPSALGSDKYVQRFLREAKVVAQMLHGNIVPVFQLGEHGGGYFIASAFIPGRTLADVVPEKGMDPSRAARLTVQLLEALAYAHERGVLHRDVKPSNAMLVEKDGHDTLYLMDFGLAGLLGQDEGRMTQDNTVMGTPAYMAPEQARGAVKEVGPASDQYSAGVVLYELLTGRLPFEGGSMHALIYNVISTPPPPPSRCRPGLDPRLETICLKVLAKKAAERFADCRAFAEALRGWLDKRRPDPPSAEKVALAGEIRKRPAPAGTASVGKLATVSVAEPGRRTTAAAPTVVPTVTLLPAPKPSWRVWLVVAGCALMVILLASGYVGWRMLSPAAAKPAAATQTPAPGGGEREKRNQQSD